MRAAAHQTGHRPAFAVALIAAQVPFEALGYFAIVIFTPSENAPGDASARR